MDNETRLERRLDRLIEHAVNPRKAAVVVATVTTAITLLAGWLMTIADHDGIPDPRVGAVVGGADGDDGRLRRPRPDDETSARSWRRCVMLLGIGFLTVITASITGRLRRAVAPGAAPRGPRAGGGGGDLREIIERLERIEAVAGLTG